MLHVVMSVCMLGAVQFLNVFILSLLCVQFIYFSNGRKSCLLGLSSVILLFDKVCLSIFHFDVWNGVWILIRPFPDVSLLFYLTRLIFSINEHRLVYCINMILAVNNVCNKNA